MPPTHHFSGTSRALYRVFVLPNLRTTSPAGIPIHFAPAFAPTYGPPSIPIPAIQHTQVRHRSYVKRDTRRHALTDYFVLDDAIAAPRVNLVDINDAFFEDVATIDALSSYDRQTHHLVQVTPGGVNEAGYPDPSCLPVCKVFSKPELRASHEKKVEIARRQAKGNAGPPQKNLELNWAIGGGDLKHRMNKLSQFLLEGRKVEVLLGSKKRGRKALPEEADATYKAVLKTADECGAREVKRDGAVGGVLMIVFEGRVRKDKDEKEKEKEKEDQGAKRGRKSEE